MDSEFSTGASALEDRGQLAEFARSLSAQRAEKRTAIARYLHDTLLQTLVVLSFTSEDKSSQPHAVTDLISACCRQARVVSSLLFVPFAEEGDLAGVISTVIENLRQDAGIQVNFEAAEDFPEQFPSELSRLIFDIVMEFLTAVVVGRCQASHRIRLGQQSGWVNLEVPARWGNTIRRESSLFVVRIDTLGGSIEETEPEFTRIRLPISPDEPSNSDRR